MRAVVTVYPRPEVLDPQGKAIGQALGRVGFAEVREVRAGKSFTIDLGIEDPERARERLRRMCETLLANTVVEDYSIEIVDEEARRSGAGAPGHDRGAGA